MDKYVKGKALRRLQPTVARCGLEIAENNWHGALADSRITGLLLFAQAKLYSELFNGELVELQQAEGVWRGDQDPSFKAWLFSQPPLSG